MARPAVGLPTVGKRDIDRPRLLCPYKYHWLLIPGNQRWECDDYISNEFFALSSGDFWKVFVR